MQDIETLQSLSLFLDKENTIRSYASGIESQVDQYFAKKKKQASIRDFLNKKLIVLNSEKDVYFCIYFVKTFIL